MKLIRLFAVLTMIACVALAVAQDPMTPPKQVSDMAWMAGDWKAEVHMNMMGQQFDNNSDMKVEMAGQFLKMTSDSEMMGMNMHEEAFLGWNPTTGKYDMHSFTSFAPTPRLEHGTLEGAKLMMVSEPWVVGGQEFVSRSTLTKVDNDTVKFLLEFKQGEDWVEAGTGTYTRKKSETKKAAA